MTSSLKASVTRRNVLCNLSRNVGKRNPLEVAEEVLHVYNLWLNWFSRFKIILQSLAATCNGLQSLHKAEPSSTASVKTRSHDPFLRIQFLLLPKSDRLNTLKTHESVILEKRIEIEHALLSSDTLRER